MSNAVDKEPITVDSLRRIFQELSQESSSVELKGLMLVLQEVLNYPFTSLSLNYSKEGCIQTIPTIVLTKDDKKLEIQYLAYRSEVDREDGSYQETVRRYTKLDEQLQDLYYLLEWMYKDAVLEFKLVYLKADEDKVRLIADLVKELKLPAELTPGLESDGDNATLINHKGGRFLIIDFFKLPRDMQRDIVYRVVAPVEQEGKFYYDYQDGLFNSYE